MNAPYKHEDGASARKLAEPRALPPKQAASLQHTNRQFHEENRAAARWRVDPGHAALRFGQRLDDSQAEPSTRLAARWQRREPAKHPEQATAIGLRDAGALIGHADTDALALRFGPHAHQ